jgi:tetratricopeptide (TPR) repeat protein
MRDTIDWSFQLLEPVERRLLQGLSVFAGGFDLEAIEAVAGDDTDRDTGDALETLAALVDRSLVERVQLAESRFRLLGTIREFAAERLESSGDAATTRDRHARYWLAVATRESEVLDGPRASTAMARLDEAADEFRSALHWTLAKSSVGDPDHLALRLVSALGRFWYLHGRVHEAASWLESALEGDPEAPAELRASVLHWSGVMLDESRMTDRAIGHFEQALELERRIGDDRTIARELNSLGVVYRNAGDLARAEPLLAESLAMRRRLGDGQGIATVLTNLGIVALDRDRVEDARQLLDEAVAVDRSLGNTSGLAYSSSALGTALLRSGRRGEALALIRSALGTFADLGDADGVAGCLEGLGEAGQRSDPGSAARLLLAAGAIRGRAGLWPHPVDRGRTEALVGSVEAALSTDELSAAAAEATAMDVPASVAFALAVLGRWAMEGSSAAQPGSVAAASPSPDGSGVVDRAPRGRDRCSP